MTQPAMIQTTNDSSWQEILAGTIKNTEELCRRLDLKQDALPADHPLLKNFPVRVPAPFLARMEIGNPNDPLLLQVFPGAAEANSTPGFINDPLEESNANPHPGILHKYKGRALLLVTSSCAIHCRYCFRRHFPYADNLPGRQHWRESLDYIANDTSLSEIIFSGGDPLTLPDAYLGWFIEELSRFDHIKRIRLHTRLPIMIPQRITESLCELLANPRFQTILVLHSNHPGEFDVEVDEACQKLSQAGVCLLNQSVLLKGINDSPATLAALSERLFSAGVLPYYLHLLDRVIGAAHFEVNEKDASVLMKKLQATLPGYLVPKLVREIPGEAAKTLAV
ncbi:MAG: EF-P beta-lysylation protein EpmB [Gammaproteobacteria bacterium]|nr:EF-P beta-lysylation protein EpmB [Gammaproteobacteria bacterium]